MGYLLLTVYNLLTPVIALGYLVFFVFSPRRRLLKNFFSELGERFSASASGTGSGAIWVHAASVGEVKALVRFIPALRSSFPGRGIMMTTSSWTGRAEALKLSPAVRLAPLDLYPLTRAFIKKAAPCALILIETEIWPNMLFCAAREGVPVFMINARLSKKTLALYRILGPLTRLIFSGVRRVLAQSPWDTERFSRLPGLEGKVIETGNLKHDLMGTSVSGIAEVSAFIKALGWEDSPVITAGSTHPEEEPVIINAWLEAKKNAPDLKLVIVPRHTERSVETETILRSRSAPFARWLAGPVAGAQCLLVDHMGLLQAFYAHSTVCFVGGTLDSTGGHNLLEPALFSKPVIFGPNYRNARQAGELLLKEKGGFLAETAPEMAAKLSSLLSNRSYLAASGENAAKALRSLKGATEKRIVILKSAIPAL